MFWKKKEKPISVKGMLEVCIKAFYTQKYGYLPTKMTTYSDRIVFNISRIDDDGNEEELVGTAHLSEERLLPFTLGDETLYWDTFDEAFRMKVLPEGEGEALIPCVYFYDNDVLAMDKAYAEENYTELALSYATLHDGKYCWFYPDGSAAPIVWETPRLFLLFSKIDRHPLGSKPVWLRSQLLVFASGYLEAKGITEDNFLERYKENLEIGKTEAES